ncbi:DNA replication protein [Alkalibacillus filiformis]|uniref:DNA replication protein n=1 Tax=Alkalibacillus filiformis TaxID=200990 RepID=A0ABU0DQW2_9BACI|nr:DnaD domain protein [Alkalibacillus filiformis]MDQ0350828.1 DNA replication protein [Alkalibacillus filiformis]
MELPFSYQRLLTEQINIPSKLLNDYNELGLNEEDLMVVLHVMNLQKSGELLPSFEQIASHMTINANEVANVLKKLKNNNYLQIEQITDEQNGQHEWYCLSPLFESLFEVEQESTQEEEGKLFQLFEQEFARTLSPIEIETVSYWLDEDQFKPPLIKAALREAVLMGKLNFRYIDRILNEWKKKGVRSVNDVKQSSQQKQNQQQAPKEKRDTSVYYNWLEE